MWPFSEPKPKEPVVANVGRTTVTITMMDGTVEAVVFTGHLSHIYIEDRWRTTLSKDKFDWWFREQRAGVRLSPHRWVPWHQVRDVSIETVEYRVEGKRTR